MSSAHKILYYITILLVLAFPPAILHVIHGGSTIFVSLAMLGICTPYLKRYRLFSIEETHLFIVLISYLLAAVMSFLINGVNKESLEYLELYAKFLLAIPFLYLLLRIRAKEAYVWYGISFATFLAGILGLLETYFNGTTVIRIHGSTNEIIYGNLSIAMAFMSIAGIGFFQKKSPWLTLIPVGAFLFGVTASILSGTRGAWIAIPALSLLIVFFYWKDLTAIKRIAIISLLLFLPLLLYKVPQTGIKTRLDQAYKEVFNYQTIDEKTSSAGQRIEMWGISWNIFIANPIIGAGPGMYHQAAQKFIKKELGNEIVARYNHPHNEYLNMMATRGFFGFFALLALFFIPGKHFYSAMRNKDKAISRLGLAGMLLILAYIHFALTEAVFERSLFVLFFTFYLALLTYHISSLSHQATEG
jgi:O-antigen ligase